jgi:hypothetical protein
MRPTPAWDHRTMIKVERHTEHGDREAAMGGVYAPDDAVMVRRPLGEQLRSLAPSLLSQRAVHRFIGYMDAQRQRLTGEGRRGRMPNRPELVARYGYDVKYASHALRLAYQGLEIARDGRLTLPMPEAERRRVLEVKRGGVPVMAEVLAEIDSVRRQIEDILGAGRTPLPPEPDWARISAWSTGAHREHWGWAAMPGQRSQAA